jgi:hypothetical protein
MADATSAQDYNAPRLVLVCVDDASRQSVINAALQQVSRYGRRDREPRGLHGVRKEQPRDDR